MIIQLTEGLVTNPRWFSLLDVVLSLLQRPDNRHSIDASQYRMIAASPWLTTGGPLRASAAEFIRLSVRSASREIASDAVVLRIDESAALTGEVISGRIIRIHPFGAIVVLVQPLHLIVEDESSDGAFVLWMARLLGRDTIIRSYRSGRLLFRHAGGKGQFGKSASALTFGVWPRPQQPILSLQLRAVALLDSDARFPGDAPNTQIAADAAPYVAFVHTLLGRYIESYVPYSYALRRMAQDGRTAIVDAFFRLDENQRRHFPIKRGFIVQEGPPRAQDHAEFLADTSRHDNERRLYETVAPDDWPILAGGFGDCFADVYRFTSYRCNPSEKGQLTRDQAAELNAFFSRLIRYL